MFHLNSKWFVKANKSNCGFLKYLKNDQSDVLINMHFFSKMKEKNTLPSKVCIQEKSFFEYLKLTLVLFKKKQKILMLWIPQGHSEWTPMNLTLKTWL